nr:ImmA/IrrE family metallo-endopeptidase [Nocardia bovistercoris]
MVGTSPIRSGADGWWITNEGVVLLAAHLDERQRRVTLAHMLAHVDLDHEAGLPVHSGEARSQEIAASRLATRRTIPLPELISALTNVGDDAELLAKHLDVTVSSLAKRMRNLSAWEWNEVRALDRRIRWPHLERRPLRCAISADVAAEPPRATPLLLAS